MHLSESSRCVQHPVHVVRHGEIDSNLVGRYAGRSVEGLNLRGVAQTRVVASLLEDAGIEGIRSSSVERARETATRVGELLGLPVDIDERLDEMLLGPWEGMLETDVARDYPESHTIWLTRPNELRLPGRETLQDVQERVTAAIADSSRSGQFLLVTHVAPIRVAILSTHGRCLSEYKSIPVPNGACFRFDLTTRSVEQVKSERSSGSSSQLVSA